MPGSSRRPSHRAEAPRGHASVRGAESQFPEGRGGVMTESADQPTLAQDDIDDEASPIGDGLVVEDPGDQGRSPRTFGPWSSVVLAIPVAAVAELGFLLVGSRLQLEPRGIRLDYRHLAAVHHRRGCHFSGGHWLGSGCDLPDHACSAWGRGRRPTRVWALRLALQRRSRVGARRWACRDLLVLLARLRSSRVSGRGEAPCKAPWYRD